MERKWLEHIFLVSPRLVWALKGRRGDLWHFTTTTGPLLFRISLLMQPDYVTTKKTTSCVQLMARTWSMKIAGSKPSDTSKMDLGSSAGEFHMFSGVRKRNASPKRCLCSPWAEGKIWARLCLLFRTAHPSYRPHASCITVEPPRTGPKVVRTAVLISPSMQCRCSRN